MSNFSELVNKAGVTDHLAVFGGGSMANAIIFGALKSGFIKKEQISISTRTEKSAQVWRDNGFPYVYSDCEEQQRKHPKGIALIAVKPQVRNTLFSAISPSFAYECIISVMAGVTIEMLGELLSTNSSATKNFIRLTPNTPCAIGSGATLLSHDTSVDQKFIDIAKQIAETMGICTVIDEKIMNGAASVTACSPAWTFMYIESLADGGVLAGCSRQDALKFAAQAVMGAAELVLKSGQHPGVLKDQVCSPNGTTIAGLRELEKGAFRFSVIEAVKASTDRANNM